jgi:hypothetical protein
VSVLSRLAFPIAIVLAAVVPAAASAADTPDTVKPVVSGVTLSPRYDCEVQNGMGSFSNQLKVTFTISEAARVGFVNSELSLTGYKTRGTQRQFEAGQHTVALFDPYGGTESLFGSAAIPNFLPAFENIGVQATDAASNRSARKYSTTVGVGVIGGGNHENPTTVGC